MPLSGSHFSELQIAPGGDASLQCPPAEVFRVCFAMDTCEGPSLPCQMPALGTKGWREGQKPILSLRNNEEIKRTCKTAGKEGSGGHWLTLEGDAGRNHCQHWMTSLCKGPGTVKPQLKRGDFVGQPSQSQPCCGGLEKAPAWTLRRGHVPVAEVLLRAQSRGSV